MDRDFLLTSESAKRLYGEIKDMPIYDYHCHLSPKEIYEDKPCADIGELWLSGDHYKWRIMRAAGVPEELVTGGASYKDKFIAYAKACESAAGSPLYTWNKMELSIFFGIDDELNGNNAAEIYDRANAYLKANRVSPRTLIKNSGVKFVGTTDDICDDLEWHEKIKADESFDVRVSPSFRCDRLLLIRADGYADYIKKLAGVCGGGINTLTELLEATERRLEFFAEHGCACTDMGIPGFPTRISTEHEAAVTFRKALLGEDITDVEYSGFLGFMFVFLGRLYKKHSLVMQMHIAVARNVNRNLFAAKGPDSGGDCIGDLISTSDIARVFNEISEDGEMPRTIIYSLEPSMTEALVSLAGSFRNVTVGAAWWFNDHKRGIKHVMECIAESGYLGSFTGMLTDSRSFLSYARHDYFRRILASYLAELVDNGEFPLENAEVIAEKIAYKNTKEMIERAGK